MWRILTLFCLIVWLGGCYSTNPSKISPELNNAYQIQAIMLQQNPPSVAPNYQRYQELVIKDDLSSHYIRKDASGAVLNETHSVLEREEYDSLVSMLQKANFSQLYSQRNLGPIPIGGGSYILSVVTPLKTYVYESSAMQIFPFELQNVLDKMRGYLPIIPDLDATP